MQGLQKFLLALFNCNHYKFASISHIIGYDHMHMADQLYMHINMQIYRYMCFKVILEFEGVCTRIGEGVMASSLFSY